MHNQYLLRLEFVIPSHGTHGLAAAIHEGERLEQVDVFTIVANFAFFGIKTFVETKALRKLLCEQIDKPESGIMAGIDVVGPGITEADDQTYICGECRHPEKLVFASLVFGSFAFSLFIFWRFRGFVRNNLFSTGFHD